MHPEAEDYAQHFAHYVSLVDEDDILAALEKQSSEMQRLLSSLDESRAAFRYAESKWSVRQVIGHVTDAEKVFAYRALALARGEHRELPGFDENTWNDNAGFDRWSVGDLAEQYALTRRANLVMFHNLPADAWQRRGIVNGHSITVNALAYVIAGHERHHLQVLRERYHL